MSGKYPNVVARAKESDHALIEEITRFIKLGVAASERIAAMTMDSPVNIHEGFQALHDLESATERFIVEMERTKAAVSAINDQIEASLNQ